MADDLIGQHVGNYVVTRLLGRGGMGEVYVAEHPEIGRTVAVKVLSRDLLTTAQLAERFLVEARAVAKIRHPNIIEVYDFGRLDDGRLYYTMEVLEGSELRGVLVQRGTMTAAEVLPYLEQICAGLQAAHFAGVVHRDLKPENIFVTKQQPLAIKLLDFGIAKLLETEAGHALTSSGILMGTPQFMAPEQAAGHTHRITARTDVYAMGVILYLMLAGRLPFVAEHAPLILAKHLQEAPPPIRSLAPRVSRPVAAVVHRCLEKGPEQRFASAAELYAAFAAAVEASVDERTGTVAQSASAPTIPNVGRQSTPAAAIAIPVMGVPQSQLGAPQPQPQTTLGGAASEVETSPTRHVGKWVAVAAGLCAVLLAGIFVARSGQKTAGRAAPDAPAGSGASPSAPTRPDAAGVRTTSPTVRHSINVKIADTRATCHVRIDDDEQELRPPCLFVVTSGSKVRLEVARPGLRPFVEKWTATADRDITLEQRAKAIVVAAKVDVPLVGRRTPRAKKLATPDAAPAAAKAELPKPAPEKPAAPKVTPPAKAETPSPPAKKKKLSIDVVD